MQRLEVSSAVLAEASRALLAAHGSTDGLSRDLTPASGHAGLDAAAAELDRTWDTQQVRLRALLMGLACALDVGRHQLERVERELTSGAAG